MPRHTVQIINALIRILRVKHGVRETAGILNPRREETITRARESAVRFEDVLDKAYASTVKGGGCRHCRVGSAHKHDAYRVAVDGLAAEIVFEAFA